MHPYSCKGTAHIAHTHKVIDCGGVVESVGLWGLFPSMQVWCAGASQHLSRHWLLLLPTEAACGACPCGPRSMQLAGLEGRSHTCW